MKGSGVGTPIPLLLVSNIFTVEKFYSHPMSRGMDLYYPRPIGPNTVQGPMCHTCKGEDRGGLGPRCNKHVPLAWG